MDWLYRFTSNPSYPDPVEEIDALCTLDDDGESAFLLLSTKNSPPMSRGTCGEVVGLCTAQNGRLTLHGTGVIAGDCLQGDTPPTMLPLYGSLMGRVFCPLKDLERIPSGDLAPSTLSLADQQTFLKGHAYVKRLSAGRSLARTSVSRGQGEPISGGATAPTKYTFPGVVFTHTLPPFTVIGLDPTAGTWASKMTEGPKKAMPSFRLRWTGTGFSPDSAPLSLHSKNQEFWEVVQSSRAALVCIDGPCGTNGPRLLPDTSDWDRNRSGGTRGGEVALSREGVSLYWTTQNTVVNFDGASRWIARSLVLFAEAPTFPKIETHPHGAFIFLWRLFGSAGTLPQKATPAGRQARLALLQAFIPGLTNGMVPDHDALDAACAALVAGLHRLNLTTPFGTPADGGQLWMPDINKLSSLLPSSPEPPRPHRP